MNVVSNYPQSHFSSVLLYFGANRLQETRVATAMLTLVIMEIMLLMSGNIAIDTSARAEEEELTLVIQRYGDDMNLSKMLHLHSVASL